MVSVLSLTLSINRYLHKYKLRKPQILIYPDDNVNFKRMIINQQNEYRYGQCLFIYGCNLFLLSSVGVCPV